jgi:hypothetical protein
VLLLSRMQMAEAEDLRFSFDLSQGCSQALNPNFSLCCLAHSEQLIVLLLLRMQMAEAEDLRFSFDLSRGCSQEITLHCSQAKPTGGEAVLCLERQLQSAQLGEECE